jgi:hypothetical protein
MTRAQPAACAADPLALLDTFQGQPARTRIRVAATRVLREQCYRLAYRVYRAMGLIPEHPGGWVVLRHDRFPSTVTYIEQDPFGDPISTATQLFDARAGFPFEDVFAPEVASLRARGARLSSIVRLVRTGGRGVGPAGLWRLINLFLIHAVRVRACTDLLIEVNPRHAGFYRRHLGFRTLAGSRPCPRAGGMPVRLLHLDLHLYVQEIGGMTPVASPWGYSSERSLYRRFLDADAERPVADALARMLRPMTRDQMRYFGLHQDSEEDRQT